MRDLAARLKLTDLEKLKMMQFKRAFADVSVVLCVATSFIHDTAGKYTESKMTCEVLFSLFIIKTYTPCPGKNGPPKQNAVKCTVQGGPAKVRPTYILPVTFGT